MLVIESSQLLWRQLLAVGLRLSAINAMLLGFGALTS